MVNLIKGSDFDKELSSSKIPVIVDFSADWCGPCQLMAPLFEDLSTIYAGKLRFLKLDTDEAGEVAERFEISSIPCLILISRGKEVGRLLGFMPKALLIQKIDEILSKV